MTSWIALLRAVNVGGQRKVSMSALHDMLVELGLREPRTLLMSGNAVFGAEARDGEALEGALEGAARTRLHLDVEFMVRDAKEWGHIIEANPFPREAESDPSHLVVMFPRAVPTAAALRALEQAISGPGTVRQKGRQLYITYPAGIGTSRLTAAAIERALGTRGTARNWNTVKKLAKLAKLAGARAPAECPRPSTRARRRAPWPRRAP